MYALSGLIVFGVLAQWIADRFKIPAILPLILIGLSFGPLSSLFTHDGQKLLEPMWTGELGLFPGNLLYSFVSLAVGVILFEGGMTLRKAEVLNIGPVVLKLISLAMVVSFLGSGLVAYYVIGLSWGVSFLFASLVVVTGPTVIGPILRQIPLKKDVAATLRWEGILIDPVGAVLAVVVFEIITSSGNGSYFLNIFLILAKTAFVGFAIGFIFAHGLAFGIAKAIIPKFLINITTLAFVLAAYALSEYFAEVSGLLTTVVMGMVIGNMNLATYRDILNFKESLSILLVSTLFILLAANMNLEDLYLIFTWPSLILFLAIVFVIRPLGVFLSSRNSPLTVNEKLFISWVGPRGIVAAGVSSLFGIKLTHHGVSGAEYITPLVFMIVLGTVLINAATARFVAKRLGVYLEKPQGILIVGATRVSRLIASYLKENGRPAVIIDTDFHRIMRSRLLGLKAFQASIYSNRLGDNPELSDVGYVMALTSNDEVNRTVIERFQKKFGEKALFTFRLITQDELTNPENNPEEGLFSHTIDFVRLTSIVRRFPQIHEVLIKSQDHYKGLLEIMKAESDMVPLFIKDKENNLTIMPSDSYEMTVEGEGNKLIYLGKALEVDNEETLNFKNVTQSVY